MLCALRGPSMHRVHAIICILQHGANTYEINRDLFFS